VCCVAKLGKSVASPRTERRCQPKERTCRLWMVRANHCPVSRIWSCVPDIPKWAHVISRGVFFGSTLGTGDRKQVRALRRRVRAMRARVDAKRDGVASGRPGVDTIPKRVSASPERRGGVRTRVQSVRTCVTVFRRQRKAAATS